MSPDRTVGGNEISVDEENRPYELQTGKVGKAFAHMPYGQFRPILMDME